MIKEYQGFSGSNYDEDDLERAKAGGMVKFFPNNARNSILESIAQNPNSLESKRISDILSNPEMQKQEIARLGDVHKRINERSAKMQSILDQAAKENPGIQNDLQNERMDHYEEFLQANPEYKSLLDEQQAEGEDYKNSPMAQQHMMDEVKKSGWNAVRGHSFTEDQFKNIMDYLNSKEQKPEE